MKRILTFIFFILLLSSVNKTYANEYFNVDLSNIYKFETTGNCNVVEVFEIENKTTEKYLPSFEHDVTNINIENVKVYNGDKIINSVIDKSDSVTKIKINFEDKVLGKGKTRQFSISYNISDLVSKTQNVWELSIPKIENTHDYNDINTTILIPKEYGREAYISPNYSLKNVEEIFIKYQFNKDAISQSRIVAGFGEYQIFTFSINYYLKNDSPNKATKFISIPPDTSYQRLFYNKIDPYPSNVIIDDDGNWLAEYAISGNSFINVKVIGSVQLFASPRKFLVPGVQNLYDNIKETKYWQTNDEKIISISKTLQKPINIYDYVINSLSYDFTLSKKTRLGALNTLTSNDTVSCREFTDLLISLLRAKGIPAREVIGYAYTDNPDVKPITFFNDVLHSWVEYWNSEQRIWMAIDPTWGATSKSDYFNKFDLRHFAFTIHGKDDTLPYPPGSYSSKGIEKDIFINFGSMENTPEKPLKVESFINKLFVFKRNIKISIYNTNPFALYDKNIKYFLGSNLYSEDNIKIIPPYSKIEKVIKIKYSFLGINTKKDIHVLINETENNINGAKLIDTYSQLILIFLIIIMTALIFLKKGSTKIKYEKSP